MNILTQIAGSENIRTLTNAANKLIDGQLPLDYSWLSPQWLAGYMGLKKLIEKDYIEEDETVLLFNTAAWYKYR